MEDQDRQLIGAPAGGGQPKNSSAKYFDPAPAVSRCPARAAANMAKRRILADTDPRGAHGTHLARRGGAVHLAGADLPQRARRPRRTAATRYGALYVLRRRRTRAERVENLQAARQADPRRRCATNARTDAARVLDNCLERYGEVLEWKYLEEQASGRSPSGCAASFEATPIGSCNARVALRSRWRRALRIDAAWFGKVKSRGH